MKWLMRSPQAVIITMRNGDDDVASGHLFLAWISEDFQVLKAFLLVFGHEKTIGVCIPKPFLAKECLLYSLTYDFLRPSILNNFYLSLYSRDYEVIVSCNVDFLQSSQDQLCLNLKIFQKLSQKQGSTCYLSSEPLSPSSYLLALLILL